MTITTFRDNGHVFLTSKRVVTIVTNIEYYTIFASSFVDNGIAIITKNQFFFVFTRARIAY